MPYEVDIIFATFTDEKISSRRNSPKATIGEGQSWQMEQRQTCSGAFWTADY